MKRGVRLYALPAVLMLTACAPATTARVEASPPALRDPLYVPDRVQPGRLSDAPDRASFPPVLTERFAYPTQAQANDAYRRLRFAEFPADTLGPAAIWLFGCKPGALDAQSTRITRYRGPVVHCATDFLDVGGHLTGRATANFYHYQGVWRMQPVSPPRVPVPWAAPERSPRDIWRWIPGRSRYE